MCVFQHKIVTFAKSKLKKNIGQCLLVIEIEVTSISENVHEDLAFISNIVLINCPNY